MLTSSRTRGWQWQPDTQSLAVLVNGGQVGRFPSGDYQPFGKSFYVDPIHGSNDFNGLSPATAVKTITTALGLCTTDHNDYIFCTGMPYNYAALSGETFPITITKNYVHIIGVSPSSWMGGRDSWNRLNGGTSTNVFNITDVHGGTYGDHLRGIEIAGLHMQASGAAGINFDTNALTYGIQVHHCGFGDWGALNYGILNTGANAEFGWGTVDQCFFGRQVAVDGILVGAATAGTLSWTNFTNNVFWKVAGIGINIANTSSSCLGACIFDNRFFQKAACDKGFAITIIAGNGMMIDGNHAMEDGGHAGNNPYLDTTSGTDTTTTNGWGLNYHGNVVTYPAFA